jgi:hypothetical protein
VRVGRTGRLVHGPKILPGRRARVNAAGIPPHDDGDRQNRCVRKAAKRTLGAGVVAGAMFAVWRAYRARMPAPAADTTWEAAPFPFPPIPRPAAPPRPVATTDHAGEGSADAVSAIEPIDGECPDSHPVKGKLASGIYHVPGGLNYARTRPDRCYVDAAAAESEGLRAAKR